MAEAALREVAAAALEASGLSGVRDVAAPPAAAPPAGAPPAGGGRVMRQPTNLLTMLVAVVIGGVASTGAASLTGPSSDAIAQMKLDIKANSAGVVEVSSTAKEIGKSQVEAQNVLLQKQLDAANEAVRVAYWNGDNSRKLSTAIALIAAKVKIEVDTRLTPFTRGGQ